MKVGFVSLGCSKNQIDTERMLSQLAEAGYEITAEDIEADVIIVNTCAFIESAKQESIDSILDVAWLKQHKNLKGIVVTGCLAERYKDEIFKELPEVDAVVGIGSLTEVVKAVEAAAKGEKFSSYLDKETMPLGGNRMLTTPPYTAYLKVAEGCDNRCTYCAIPLIRGKFRSRPIEELVEEAKTLEEMGVQELNIIAQDTSRYGVDLYGEYSLAKLVKAITAKTKIPWIRLLYCYPDKITDELLEEYRTNPRLLHYIDLPIQHINNRVLKDMNRHGDRIVIEDTIRRIRNAVPDMIIRTTVIVGFPGETETEFEELCEFVKQTKFTHLGAFTYSAEEDTPAAKMDGQIDEQTKQNRYDIIMQTQLQLVELYNAAQIGKKIDVMVEGFDPVSEAFYGRSAADAPDIDGKIYFTAVGTHRLKAGSIVSVEITEVIDYDLVGVKV